MDSDSIQNDDDLRRLAKKRVGIKMGFYTHLLVFVLVNGGFYLLRGLANGFDSFGGGDGSLQGMGIKDRMLASEIEALKRRQR